MFRRYHRFLILSVAGLLALPLATGILVPQNISTSAELRLSAPLPEAPRSVAAWITLPSRLDAYLQDHFGLRQVMIHAQAVITHLWLGSGDDLVQIGRKGWFFYRGDKMILQSAGLLVRKSEVIQSADLLARIANELSARGIKFIVASPPNSATIYSDLLPDWAGNRSRPTEYDLMLKALAARGVLAIDLRPALREARSHGAVYYRYDTHWTSRGALAAFNAIAAADGHADWQLDASSVIGRPIALVGGDLARILGVNDDVSELYQPLLLPRAARQSFGPQPFPTSLYVSKSGQGPTIMVIGDSFTMDFFTAMVLAHAARVAWTHHLWCGFDWKWIEQFHPDEVWWMPAERYLLCFRQPSHMPARRNFAAQISEGGTRP